ncbi:MAG: efflux transporter outer membrane subunit [Thermoguttaceae bacterium]
MGSGPGAPTSAVSFRSYSPSSKLDGVWRPGAPGRRSAGRAFTCLAGLLLASMLSGGCTSTNEYIHNGFKVGPNYSPPPAPVAQNWIDANDVRVRKQSDDLSKWWVVFKDPVLESLICSAYQQNLSLRVAACRVLEARAQMMIDVGNLFPQTQTATGSYTRNVVSDKVANSPFGEKVTSSQPAPQRWFNLGSAGFNLSWELDFWGRLRRAIESDAASLDASVENYDDVLVTLLGDVATNYVSYRTSQQRIKYAKENVALQRKTLQIVEGQRKVGIVGELDVVQARSTLEQTEAAIPELEIAERQAANQLCILLGMPVQDLQARLGSGPIPTAPPEVAVGMPADLLRRRPDVRRAERQAAAQSAQIGIAEAQFYPFISVNGAIGYSAQNFSSLFQEQALTGTVGPSFTWNILNYGRLVNNVRLQDARFQELVATYQNTVLSADQDAENGLVTFLRAQQRAKSQAASVADAKRAVDIVVAQYSQGVTDLTRVTLLQQNLVPLEDTLAQAQGEIATGLIQVYRALGGGWEIRLEGCNPGALSPPEAISTPAPASP